MVRPLAGKRRLRVSVPIPPDRLRAIDAYLAEHPEMDRNQVIDEALDSWFARRQDEAMIAQYEAPRSPAEEREHEAWRQIRRAAARRTFDRADA